MTRPDLSLRNTTHGLSNTPEYDLWCGMKQRCYYPKHKSFKYYGGRGIKVCDRWLDFENFLSDMGSKPENKTLDRVNKDGDYSPENCKWSTYKEQMRNTTRNNLITFKGKTMCVADWALELNISYTKLRMRLHRGWNIERAFA